HKQKTPACAGVFRIWFTSEASAPSARSIAKRLHLVVITLYALVLAFDHDTHLCWQISFQRLAVALHCHVLATLALVENRLVILASDHRLEIDPATVHVSGEAGAGFRIPPH